MWCCYVTTSNQHIPSQHIMSGNLLQYGANDNWQRVSEVTSHIQTLDGLKKFILFRCVRIFTLSGSTQMISALFIIILFIRLECFSCHTGSHWCEFLSQGLKPVWLRWCFCFKGCQSWDFFVIPQALDATLPGANYYASLTEIQVGTMGHLSRASWSWSQPLP